MSVGFPLARRASLWLALGLLCGLLLAGCDLTGTRREAGTGAGLKVLATTTFLTDIAQQVAGSRYQVASLIPPGTEPHAFTPTPADLRLVADADVLIVHGQGLEQFMERSLAGERRADAATIEAAAGLQPKARGADEADMHFWMDPNLALTYVENIRLGLSAADPAGASLYEANARAYAQQLRDLDVWIRAQIESVPQARRLLVTDHEELGYYADRYGLQLVGAVMPSVAPGSAPSAQALANLVAQVKRTGAPALFVGQDANPQLAQQVANEAGIKVAPPLYTHSLSAPGGPAASYLEMLRYDTNVIVQALR
ncbi:MAG: metal ABC transporter solute-binding protein, Zn/Mn family [Chloroflexota bacterium]